MINAKIVDTFLGAIKNNEELTGAVQIICSAKDHEKLELGPILLNDINDLFKIMETIGVARWEDVKGMPVQIEVNEDKISTIANIYDDEKRLNFFVNDTAPAEETDEVEELKDVEVVEE